MSELKKQQTDKENLSENIFEYNDDMTIVDWAKKYLETFGYDLSRNTKITYRGTINKLENFFGETKLTDLTLVNAQEFINTLKASGLGSASIRLHKTIFSVFIKKALELEVISKNPLDRVKLPKSGKKQIHPFNEEELSLFFSEVKDSKYSNLYKILVLTGLRIHEALALQWKDIDGQKLHVSKQFGRLKSDTNFYPTKNKEERTVPLPREAIKILETIRESQEQQEDFENPQKLIFIDKRGNRITYESVKYDFYKRTEKMDRPDVRIHDLRHTYAMLNLRAGNNPKMISEALGHANVAFTLNVYAYTTEEMRIEQAETFQKFLEKIEF